MSDTTTVSPLRQRMIEDMAARKLNPHTQRGHISSCKRFAVWLKRSPDTATPDEVRRFQLHLIESGASICNRNRIMTGSCSASRCVATIWQLRSGTLRSRRTAASLQPTTPAPMLERMFEDAKQDAENDGELELKWRAEIGIAAARIALREQEAVEG